MCVCVCRFNVLMTKVRYQSCAQRPTPSMATGNAYRRLHSSTSIAIVHVRTFIAHYTRIYLRSALIFKIVTWKNRAPFLVAYQNCKVMITSSASSYQCLGISWLSITFLHVAQEIDTIYTLITRANIPNVLIFNKLRDFFAGLIFIGKIILMNQVWYGWCAHSFIYSRLPLPPPPLE